MKQLTGCAVVSLTIACLSFLGGTASKVWAEEAQSGQAQFSGEPGYEGQVVSSPRLIPEPIENTAHSVQVVTGEQIEERVERSVSEGIRLEPGVFVQSIGTRGESTNIRLRGATNADTLVFLDGVRLNNPFDNGTNLSLIPVELIDRIEVLQGSQAVLYGGAAVGGVVSIFTKPGTDENEFRLSAEGGNLGHARAVLTWRGSVGKKLRYSLGVSRTDQRGQFANDDFHETSLTQRWDITPTDKLDIQITSHIFLNTKGLARGFLLGPGQLYDPTLPADSGFIQITPDNNRHVNNLLTTESFKLGYQWNDNFRTELLYGFYLSDADEQDSSIGSPGSLTPSGILLAPNSVRNQVRAVRQKGDVRQLFLIPDLGKIKQSVIAGFEFYDERVSTQGTAPLPGDPPPPAGSVPPIIPPLDTIPGPGIPGDRQNYAPYVQYHLSHDEKFFLDAGFRWDINSAYSNELSPRVAMAYRFDKIGGKLHGAYGEGFLPPTILQLFNPIFGNPDLSPQTSQSYEAGYQQNIGRKAYVWATFFYLDFDGLITRLGTNSDDALSLGVESGFQVQIIPQLSLGGNYTFTHTRDESNGNIRIANVPNHIFNVYLSATPWRSLKIDSNFSFVSDQFEPFPIVSTDGRFINGTAAASLMGGTNPGWTRWDLAVSYDFQLINPNQKHPQSVKVYAKGNNLLNNRYEEIFGFPSPGFNFITGAELLF